MVLPADPIVLHGVFRRGRNRGRHLRPVLERRVGDFAVRLSEDLAGLGWLVGVETKSTRAIHVSVMSSSVARPPRGGRQTTLRRVGR